MKLYEAPLNSIEFSVLDTRQRRIHTSHAHAQGKFILLECTGNLLDCTVNLLDAWLSRVRALYAYMPCTAQQLVSKTKIHAS